MTQTFANFAYITGFCLANKTPCKLFLYKQPNNTIKKKYPNDPSSCQDYCMTHKKGNFSGNLSR